jgi:NADH-quinone oxidoreductase subunit N
LVIAIIQAGDLAEIGREGDAFSGMFSADQFTYMVNIIALIGGFIGILVSYDYLERTGTERGEFYTLILFSALGAMLMGSSRNLVMIFIALELLSIPLYVLSGFRRPMEESEESAIKYFLLGAFASGFLVYGIALVYGATGSFDVATVWTNAVEILRDETSGQFTLLVGIALVIIGLGFKVGAVPFHMWQPDVYQGAPTPVTAFMSSIAKTGGFAAMARVLITGLVVVSAADGNEINTWQDTINVLALLTMVLGNFVAIAQTDLKRMLAYSSIAHAGYILVAIASGGTAGVGDTAAQATLIYLMTYAFTNIGAFAVVIAIEHNDTTGTAIEDVKGLAQRNPMLAAVMTIFMFSLTGIPLTAGFAGKWFVFRAAVEANLEWLAVAGVLASVVSAYYYLRIVVNMYMYESPTTEDPVQGHPNVLRAALWLAAGGTVVLGILPYILSDLAQDITLAVVGK